MKQQKLNYRFHDPNPPDVMAEFLFRLFIEVNKNKVDRALRAAAEEIEKEERALLHSQNAEGPQKESVCQKLKDLSSAAAPTPLVHTPPDQSR